MGSFIGEIKEQIFSLFTYLFIQSVVSGTVGLASGAVTTVAGAGVGATKAVGSYAVGAACSVGGAAIGAASKIPGATTVGKMKKF